MRDSDAYHSCDFCRRQALRVEELEEQVRQLKDELNAVEYMAPRELALSMAQTRMLGMMLRHDRVVTPEALFDATRSHMTRRTEHDPKLMQVNVWKLRDKLKRFNLAIETVHGFGWRLTPETRHRLLNWYADKARAA